MTTTAGPKEQKHVESDIANYDKTMVDALAWEYYGHSGFYNFGYWTPETRNQREASENLVNRLLAWIPEKRGTILDVACGMGATTRMLLDHYPPHDVYALNYSPKQMAMALSRAPESGLVSMDASHLGFADESFDNLICVEAAFHFNTRRDFVREAMRVLKPGGRLVHSDIAMANRRRRPANYLRNPEELAELLKAEGFVDVEVVDCTEECFKGFARNIRAWPRQERKAGRLGLAKYVWLSLLSRVFVFVLKRVIRYYMLSSARKPA